MTATTCMAAVLVMHAALAHADTADAIPAAGDADDRGAYLSAAFGNGRIHGGNASGDRWMRGRTFKVRCPHTHGSS